MNNQSIRCRDCAYFDSVHNFCSKLTVRHPQGKVYLERLPDDPACQTAYQPKALLKADQLMETAELY